MANTLASTLITRALDNASRLGTSTTKSGTTLSNFGINVLNSTMYRMSRKHDFREMKKIYTTSTVAGTRTYPFPGTGTYKTIYDMRLIDGASSVKLEYIQGQHFDEAVPYPESGSEGRPRWYIPYGNAFDLQPIADDAYNVIMKCTIWPTVITVTTDRVDFEPDKDDVIVYGMTEDLFSLLQMHEDAAVYGGKFKIGLRDAILNDSNYPDWNPVGRGFSFPVVRDLPNALVGCSGPVIWTT